MSRGTQGRLALGLIACAGLLVPVAKAQTGPNDLPPGYRQRELHDPSSSRYLWRQDRGDDSDNGSGGGGGVVPLPVPVPWYPRYPRYYPPYGYPPYYGYPYGYPLYPPPVWVPAEQMYGPGAINRMLNSTGAASAAGNIASYRPQEVAKPRPAPAVVAAPKQRRVSDAARARATKYVEVGDEAFREQNYAMALARYRRASSSAPDRAEWRFRTGQALVALGRYSDAAQSFREGLEIDPAAPRGNMRLDVLYGPNQVAKVAHLEALAQEAIADPNDGDLLFLMGVELFMDGQRGRSRKFFERADQLVLGSNGHIKPFLNIIPVEEEVAEKNPANGERDL